jgi:UDP-glucuronate decarboxylase
MIDGLIRMMNSADDFYGPVNIGNPSEFTILELAQKVIRLTLSNSRIIFQPLPSDDPTQRKPDIALAEKKLKWIPKVDLENGLIKTIQYFHDMVKTS